MDNHIHGFKCSEIVEAEHYMLGDGCLPTDVIMPDGQWGAYLPEGNIQNKNGLETEACTIFGPHHATAILGKKKYGPAFQANLSPRFNAILANIGPGGADPHSSCEAIRKSGFVPDVFFPFTTEKTWAEYYSPNPPSIPAYNLPTIANHWLGKYTWGHDWVFKDSDPLETKFNAMKYALTLSPLTVASFAWSLHADGKYYKDGGDDHDFVVFGYVENEYWLAFDSYLPHIKKLAWNTNFDQCKRFHLALNNPLAADDGLGILEPSKKSLFGMLYDAFEDIFKNKA